MSYMREKEILSLSPLGGHDLVFTRFDDGPRFNYVQHVRYHSPTGMEWGYGGSGPADAALNALLLFVGGREALRLHQYFKEDLSPGLPHEGGTIAEGTIREWIEAHKEAEEDPLKADKE